MTIRKTLLLLIAAILLTSCGISRGDLILKDISNFKMDNPSSNGAEVSFDVNLLNNSGKVTIKDSEFTVYSANDKYLCDVKLLEEVKISKGESTVRVPVEVKLDGGVLGLLKIVPYLKGDSKDIYIKGSITGKKGIITIKQEFAKIKISDFK